MLQFAIKFFDPLSTSINLVVHNFLKIVRHICEIFETISSAVTHDLYQGLSHNKKILIFYINSGM